MNYLKVQEEINKGWKSGIKCEKCGFYEEISIEITEDQTPFEYFCKGCGDLLFVACKDEEQNKEYISSNYQKLNPYILN
jgi:uncharacterized Zn finger protein